MSTTIDEYREKLFGWQWRYAGAMQFDGALDPAHTAALGSPVFRQGASAANVLLRPDDDHLMRTRVVGQVATRRRSFRSMASSQALAQSVFGNLAARGRLGCLAGLADEAGRPSSSKAKRRSAMRSSITTSPACWANPILQSSTSGSRHPLCGRRCTLARSV